MAPLILLGLLLTATVGALASPSPGQTGGATIQFDVFPNLESAFDRCHGDVYEIPVSPKTQFGREMIRLNRDRTGAQFVCVARVKQNALLLRLVRDQYGAVLRRFANHNAARIASTAPHDALLPRIVSLLIWASVGFGLLSGAFGVVSFLIGDRGAVVAKHKLADWYVFVEAGDWGRIPIWSAGLTERILASVLGSRLFTLRSVSIWFGLNFLFVALLAYKEFHLTIKPAVYWPLAPAAASLVLGSVDFASLAVGRILLRRTSASGDVRLCLLLVAYAVLVSFVTTEACALLITASFPHANLLYSLVWLLLIMPPTIGFFILILLATSFSSVLFLTITMIALLVFATRGFSKPLTSLLIERMAEAHGGVFVLLLVTFSGIAELLNRIHDALADKLR